jgi:hypothetical protein
VWKDVNQGLKTWAFSVPKNPLAGHSAQGEQYAIVRLSPGYVSVLERESFRP